MTLDVAVCAAVYRVHAQPNAPSIARELPAALGGLSGELIVTLNGVDADAVGLDPATRRVPFPVNRGVAPGWNAAAAAADAEVLVFCNDDVSLRPDSLALLHRALVEHPEAGIVGPEGSRFDFRTGRGIEWLSVRGLEPGTLVPCDVVSGFLFAVRRRDFEAVGGFDEAYAPAIMEEIDLAMAIHHRLGLSSFAVAGVGYAHEWGVSSAKSWRRVAHNGRQEFLFMIHRRNRRHFFRKWAEHL